MMEPMFEIPSKKVKKFEVTLAYAKEQIGKANLNVLREKSE